MLHFIQKYFKSILTPSLPRDVLRRPGISVLLVPYDVLRCHILIGCIQRMAAGIGVLVGTGGNLTHHLHCTSGFQEMAGWPAAKGLSNKCSANNTKKNAK